MSLVASRTHPAGKMLPWVAALLLVTVTSARATTATGPERIPIVLDTDIGNDIDDAFALAMVARVPGLELQAVTTVSGDTHARARIAAKLLQVAGSSGVPVAAGTAGKDAFFAQARWAESFTSPSLVSESAVDLMRDKIDGGQGKTILVALGPLTNVAELLRRYPEERKKISRIALMGGSLTKGYSPGSSAIAESNIASDVSAAQVVFASGVPLLVAPLDATARLQMDAPHLQELFAHNTPLTDSLHALYLLWGQSTPTLHDVLPLALLLEPALCQTRAMHIEVSNDGWTRTSDGIPNAVVAVNSGPVRVIDFYEGVFTPK